MYLYNFVISLSFYHSLNIDAGKMNVFGFKRFIYNLLHLDNNHHTMTPATLPVSTELTSAMVHLAAFAMGILKFLADFLKTRFPYMSAFQAFTRAKSPVMDSSMM